MVHFTSCHIQISELTDVHSTFPTDPFVDVVAKPLNLHQSFFTASKIYIKTKYRQIFAVSGLSCLNKQTSCVHFFLWNIHVWSSCGLLCMYYYFRGRVPAEDRSVLMFSDVYGGHWCVCVSSPWRWGPCGRSPCCASTAVPGRCPGPGWAAHSTTGTCRCPTAAPSYRRWCTRSSG